MIKLKSHLVIDNIHNIRILLENMPFLVILIKGYELPLTLHKTFAADYVITLDRVYL